MILCHFQAIMTKMCLFQLCKCEAVFFSCVVYDRKLIVLMFWTVGRTKQTHQDLTLNSEILNAIFQFLQSSYTKLLK